MHLGICQDHDVKGTSLVLPCTQRHKEFQMTFRGCSGNAKNGYSRIRTATRSNCGFLCLFIRQVAPSRQTRQLLAKVVFVPTLLTCRFSCCNLDWGFRSGHISSIFLSMARRTSEEQTSSVGSPVPRNEKPFRNVERLCYLFSRFHFLYRHESQGRNLVLRPLSGFITQS